MKKYNLIGNTFTNLFVVSKYGVTPSHKVLWECRCLLCGNTTYVTTGHLISGHITSCGCQLVKHNDSHGRHKLYSVWIDIKRRCYDHSNKSFKYYGEVGVTVCSEWKEDYLSFKKWALSNGYKEGLTIDRIDNYKGYSPDNCRWVSRADNNRNKRKHQDKFGSLIIE